MMIVNFSLKINKKTPTHREEILFKVNITHMKKLSELSITDKPLLIFAKVQLDEAALHIEGHPLVQHRLSHHLSELICKCEIDNNIYLANI